MDFTNLRTKNMERHTEWAGESSMSKEFRAIELGGEVGEVLNEVKKLAREELGIVGSRTTVDDLADEIADVIISADLLAMDFGIDLAGAVKRKFNKTSDKYELSTKFDQ